ncbi:MAG: hypothetical protein ROZ37_01270 [Aromatoleum sp.]|uniref:hypothetical protein n=1 Tax=Aromatoleum sp. TaxID=2307007 RepID=UPI002893E5EA|nr:hypothetical protein [Aromatoleum sp.]MDT3668946.1 hypothetical protein [Aromatoleum sp.]
MKIVQPVSSTRPAAAAQAAPPAPLPTAIEQHAPIEPIADAQEDTRIMKPNDLPAGVAVAVAEPSVEYCGNCASSPCRCGDETPAAAEPAAEAPAQFANPVCDVEGQCFCGRCDHDVITIVRDAAGKLGKSFQLGEDGRVTKSAVVHLSMGCAVMRRVPDHAALRALLMELGDDPHAALINGGFRGIKVGEPFMILSERNLRKLCKTDSRDELTGVHTKRLTEPMAGFAAGARVKIVGRLKDNIEPSSWQILDRDVDEHTPPQFAAPEFDWIAAVDRILPGVAAAERTMTCSSSARVFRDAQPVGAGNGHTWIQVRDPSDIERIRAAAIVRAAEHGLAWLKPKLSRASGEVTGNALTTVFDSSVWDRARLVFCGRPQAGAGLTVGPQVVESTDVAHSPEWGAHRLDTTLAALPTTPERIREITRAAGVSLTLRTENGRFVFDDYEQLRLATELDMVDGMMTVADLIELGAPKLRCQAPFRASDSMAAYTGKSADGRPFVHDSGTNTNHWLCNDDWAQASGMFDDFEAEESVEGPEAAASEGSVKEPGAVQPADVPQPVELPRAGAAEAIDELRTETATQIADAPAEAFPGPFPGVMSDVVEAILESAPKPQPELSTLAVLIAMAAACDGSRCLPSGGRLNLYGVGIAQTGAGKEHPRQAAGALAEACGARLIGKPASGQGLEDALTEGPGMIVELDEIAHVLEALYGTNKPPHLIELSSVLLRLYSASSTVYATRVRAQARGVSQHRTVANPCVNLIGFATPETLGRALTSASIEDGLLGRLLIVPGRQDVAPRRVRARFELPEHVTGVTRLLRSDLAAFEDDPESSGTISVTPTADALLEELLHAFDAAMRQSSEAFARALLVRSYEKCERIAGVLAVFDQPNAPVVDVRHVEWAARFVKASDRATLRFCADFMHGGKVQAAAALVLKTVKRALQGEFTPQRRHEIEALKNGAVARSMVLRATKLSKRELDEAIEHLAARVELVELVDRKAQKDGRDVKRHLYSLPYAHE